MKVALCFIINYDHILIKEKIWKEWIEPNKDIINVYFYYKDISKINSKWILDHIIPSNYIYETSYLHIIPAYFSLMNYAIENDSNNLWFCMLTDSCCPIISPKKFRYLFYNFYNKSIINCKKAWWNIQHNKRSNLYQLPEELRLGNDPWFIMKRENVLQCLSFVNLQKKITSIISSGGIANESLFAIILYIYKEFNFSNTYNKDKIFLTSTHIIDWNRKKSHTSPHVFKEGNEIDIQFIEKSLSLNNNLFIFIRKIDVDFPDKILNYYIYEYNKENEKKIILQEPFIFKYYKIKFFINKFKLYLFICFIFLYYLFVL
jgi:hypothetical protein